MTLRGAYESVKNYISSLSIVEKKDLSIFKKKTIKHIVNIFIALITIILLLIFVYVSLLWFPHWQVAQFGMTKPKDLAEMENSYRATIAQILGGVAIVIGIYFAWENLKTTREGQITERFTRAIDQLGNPNMVIRLGGIYALERISNESKKDYWPIMEILTAYIRKNSSIKNESIPEQGKVSLDIQAILTIIGKRKESINAEDSIHFDMQYTYLQGANLRDADLRKADLRKADLRDADLSWADLRKADLRDADLRKVNLMGADLKLADLTDTILDEANLAVAHLQGDILVDVHLEKAKLERANLRYASLYRGNLQKAFFYRANLQGALLAEAKLEGAYLIEANLKKADLSQADLQGVDFYKADLEGANLHRANLEGAINITFNQLSKVETLYNAKIDEDLLIPLKEQYPALFHDLSLFSYSRFS